MGTAIDTLGADIANCPVVATCWVNYDQVTPAIEDSFNVDSVTDNSAGYFTINFTNALADALYGWASSCANSAPATSANLSLGPYAGSTNGVASEKTTAAFGFVAISAAGSETDCADNGVIIFGGE